MRSFLLKDKMPILRWQNIPEEVYFEGPPPEGFHLAISPSAPYVVLDIDRNENKNGFKYIPEDILEELSTTFYYNTQSGGRHYWLKYTGNKELRNRATLLGIDLRCNSKGYVKWHCKEYKDIRECLHLVKETSLELNKFIENLFYD